MAELLTGSGSMDYVEGSIVLKCKALKDLGSDDRIVFSNPFAYNKQNQMVEVVTSGFAFHSTTSEGWVKEPKEVLIYPNPASGSFHLAGGSNDIQAVELYSLAGKKMATFPAFKRGQALFDVSTLPTGTYLVKIITPRKTIHKTIVIR
jgi:hypothetical protein